MLGCSNNLGRFHWWIGLIVLTITGCNSLHSSSRVVNLRQEISRLVKEIDRSETDLQEYIHLNNTIWINIKADQDRKWLEKLAVMRNELRLEKSLFEEKYPSIKEGQPVDGIPINIVERYKDVDLKLRVVERDLETPHLGYILAQEKQSKLRRKRLRLLRLESEYNQVVEELDELVGKDHRAGEALLSSRGNCEDDSDKVEPQSSFIVIDGRETICTPKAGPDYPP